MVWLVAATVVARAVATGCLIARGFAGAQVVGRWLCIVISKEGEMLLWGLGCAMEVLYREMCPGRESMGGGLGCAMEVLYRYLDYNLPQGSPVLSEMGDMFKYFEFIIFSLGYIQFDPFPFRRRDQKGILYQFSPASSERHKLDAIIIKLL
jgi:hypothetical protein